MRTAARAAQRVKHECLVDLTPNTPSFSSGSVTRKQQVQREQRRDHSLDERRIPAERRHHERPAARDLGRGPGVRVTGRAQKQTSTHVGKQEDAASQACLFLALLGQHEHTSDLKNAPTPDVHEDRVA